MHSHVNVKFLKVYSQGTQGSSGETRGKEAIGETQTQMAGQY